MTVDSGSGDVGAIVVVDDEPALRLLCRINLESEGYRVREAGTAAELDRILAVEDVAAVLLDLGLGADDGAAVAKGLRERRPEVAIAFFTGSEAALGAEVRPLADAVLTKPFTLERLSETVRLLLA